MSAVASLRKIFIQLKPSPLQFALLQIAEAAPGHNNSVVITHCNCLLIAYFEKGAHAENLYLGVRVSIQLR